MSTTRTDRLSWLQHLAHGTMGMVVPALCFLAGFDTRLFTEVTAYLTIACLIGKVIDNFRKDQEYCLIDVCYFNALMLLYNQFGSPSKTFFVAGYILSSTPLVAFFMYTFRYSFTNLEVWLNFILHIVPIPFYLCKEVELGFDLSELTAGQILFYGMSMGVIYSAMYTIVIYFLTYKYWSKNPKKLNLYRLTMKAKFNQALAKRFSENLMMAIVVGEFLVTVLFNTTVIALLFHQKLGLLCFVLFCAFYGHVNSSTYAAKHERSNRHQINHKNEEKDN